MDALLATVRDLGLPVSMIALGLYATRKGWFLSASRVHRDLEFEREHVRTVTFDLLRTVKDMSRQLDPELPTLVIDPAWRQRCSGYASGTGKGYAVSMKYPTAS